jgi:hypothetical protein
MKVKERGVSLFVFIFLSLPPLSVPASVCI